MELSPRVLNAFIFSAYNENTVISKVFFELPTYLLLTVYKYTPATLAWSLCDLWRVKQPLCGCFMLILGTLCLAKTEMFDSGEGFLLCIITIIMSQYCDNDLAYSDVV